MSIEEQPHDNKIPAHNTFYQQNYQFYPQNYPYPQYYPNPNTPPTTNYPPQFYNHPPGQYNSMIINQGQSINQINNQSSS
jgi:hypothetical protein